MVCKTILQQKIKTLFVAPASLHPDPSSKIVKNPNSSETGALQNWFKTLNLQCIVCTFKQDLSQRPTPDQQDEVPESKVSTKDLSVKMLAFGRNL